MEQLSQLSQTQAQAQPFDRDLSLRIDAVLKAIDDVRAWPPGEMRRACLGVLYARLRQLEAQVMA
jgi:hypothetical protein